MAAAYGRRFWLLLGPMVWHPLGVTGAASLARGPYIDNLTCLARGLLMGDAATAGDRIASRALALMGPSSAFPPMPNTPQKWYALRHKVQTATASMSDAALTDRVARLQLKWRKLRSAATFNLLQELYVEQHRRSHAS